MSGLGGGGLVGWMAKSAIERTLNRLDRIEQNIAAISHQIAALNVRAAEMSNVRQDLKEHATKIIELTLKSADHKKDIDAAHQQLRAKRG